MAGIFTLNAQDDIQPADNAQPAAQSNIVEKSAGQNGADKTSPKTSDNVAAVAPAVSSQETSAAESPSVSTEKNVPAAQPQPEATQTVSTVKPDQSKIDAPAGPEKETSKGEKAPEFEIDRNGAAGKGMNGKQTGKPSKTVKEPVVEEKPVVAGEKEPTAVQKREGKGLFWGLFGSGKEQKPLESKAGPKAAQHPVADEQGDAENKELTPEELLAAQEEVRRQAKEIEGLKKLDQAYQEMSQNEFENALKSFQEALSAMPVRPHTVGTRQKAIRSEAECAYRLALKSYLEGNVKGAQDGIRRTLEFFPAHRGAARLDERIKQDQTRRAQIESQPIPPKMSPAYQDKQKKIKSELQRGREYMAIKEYDSAEGEFKSVLIDDRLNPEASANLKKIAEKRYNLETDEFQRMKAEMLAQIRDAWTPPIKKIITGPKGETAETIITSQARRRLLDKLNNITIEKIDFRNANIVDVISYLHQQSIVSDRDQTPGEKGVNILLNLRRPGETTGRPAAPAAPQAEATDVFAAEVASPPAGGTAGAGSIPSITLTLTRISLMQALKYITECAGLKYRIEENVVVIFPADIAYGELETRTYKVQPSIAETFSGGGAAPGGEGDRLELGGSKGPVTAERKDMKQFFINASIPFPEGTSIVYIPGQTLLIVKNTPENLESFERLLNKLNVPLTQIEIEARFVEIGQNDLEELGLEWLLTDNWELARKQSGLPPSMQERIQMNKNNITKGLRELNMNLGQVAPAVGGNMGSIMSISSILTNPELTVVLHALEQRDGVNLLSAPKVTTKNGGSAEIKVVEELRYPTEYQQQAQSIGTTSAGNQSLVQIVVTPSAFETRDTGVILTIQQVTVGPDGETIDLQMVPQVVELQRWIDYGSDVPTGDANRTQHLTLNQPIFHSRSITTSISIWDGQTVVMGGLISEGQRNSEDKIPLLGDIPLLGYLFRTKTTQSIKKNLLIFVTANLVDPAGNKIKRGTAAPLPAAAGLTLAAP